jgi:acyl-CoA synthetase (AMP-forming)/AMP-acid ligase II
VPTIASKARVYFIVPRELEEALLELGHLAEACVFPINDKEIGNRIGAAVVLRPDEGALDEKDIASALTGRIAPFKFPQNIFPLKDLPKNVNGKTQRSALVKLLVS